MITNRITKSAVPSNKSLDPVDPRENGSLVAQLQVATELVDKLRKRVCRLADAVQNTGSDEPMCERETHMQLLSFPGEIISDVRTIELELNRIEGALGV